SRSRWASQPCSTKSPPRSRLRIRRPRSRCSRRRCGIRMSCEHLLYPPLEGGSKSALRGFREGANPTVFTDELLQKEKQTDSKWSEPLPEKCFAFFDPPSRGG